MLTSWRLHKSENEELITHHSIVSQERQEAIQKQQKAAEEARQAELDQQRKEAEKQARLDREEQLRREAEENRRQAYLKTQEHVMPRACDGDTSSGPVRMFV